MPATVQIAVTEPAVEAKSKKTTKSAKATKPTKIAKVAKATTPSAHPPFINMIQEAIKEIKDRKGASKQAIFKYIVAKYNIGDAKINNNRFCKALNSGVSANTLVQTSGNGANGRFRLPPKVAAPAKTESEKPVPKKSDAPKAAAAKPKKVTAVATASEEKTTSTKTKSAKSPKKAAAKAPKSPKKSSPKKTAAKAPKSPKASTKSTVKKSAKSPAKKATKAPKKPAKAAAAAV